MQPNLFLPVINALGDPDPLMRKSVARDLVRGMPLQYVRAVLEKFEVEQHPEVVKWLAAALAETRLPGIEQALARKIETTADKEARDWIRASMGVVRSPSTSEVKGLVTSGDSESRHIGATLAWGISDPRVDDYLIRALQDESAAIRRWSLLTLSRHNRLPPVEVFSDNLVESDFRLREWTAHVVAPLASPAMLKMLVDAYEHEKHPRVREWIARALSNYGEQEVRDFLYARHRTEPDAFVREAITIGIIRGPRLSGDVRFLCGALLRETSVPGVGEMLRAITRVPSHASNTELMKAAEEALDGLGEWERMTRVFAPDLIETAPPTDKSAVSTLQHSAGARMMATILDLSSKIGSEPSEPSVVLAVALAEEAEVVVPILRGRGIDLTPRPDQTGRWYYEGRYVTGQGVSCRVYVVVSQMGPTVATAEGTRVMLTLRPDILFVVGVAGALTKDLALCDLAVMTFGMNYLENTKAVSSPAGGFSFERAGEPFRSDTLLVQRAEQLKIAYPDALKSLQEERAELLRSRIPESDLAALMAEKLVREDLTLKAGPIATGPAVGASEEFSNWLLSNQRNYVALDMESGAVAAAVYLMGAKSGTRFLAVRGISDFADSRKKCLDQIGRNGLRQVATTMATVFCLTLLNSIADLLRHGRR